MLLVLAMMLPVIIQSAGPWGTNDPQDVVSPNMASFPDYLHTIGVTGVAGTDNAHLSYHYGVGER
jgi:hypothetical protein